MNRLRSNDPCWCGSGRKHKRCHGLQQARRRPPVAVGQVSPRRTVPQGIGRPPYVGGSRERGGLQIFRDPDELAALRRACRIAAEVLAETGARVRPGITTDELDVIAHEAYLARGAYPSTLGYGTYTKSICTSVNEVICHGIPDDRPLAAGDIVNIDVTAYVDGFHGDTSATFLVGDVDEVAVGLVESTREALDVGIAAVAPGERLRAVGAAIQRFARARGYGVVPDYGGHGIGRAFHAEPHVHHTDEPSATTRLVPGLVFTVEPMLTAGAPQHRLASDGWTVATADGSLSAQFEHTILVTEDGSEILTHAE
jgi:methionyl aminopeptidase